MTLPTVTVSLGRLTGWVLGESLLGFGLDGVSLVAWYDFSDGPTSLFTDTARTTPVANDGDIIKGVTDKSGAGSHLSEATNGPTYKTGANGINGLSVALGDGSNDVLTGSVGTYAQPVTLAVVVRHATGTGAQQLIFSDSDSIPEIYQHSTGVWSMYAGTAEVPNATDVNTATHIVMAIFNGASSKLYLNGGTATTGNPGSSGITAGFKLFGEPTHFLNGSIGEAMAYNSALAINDLNTLGMYLASKWGTTWTTAT